MRKAGRIVGWTALMMLGIFGVAGMSYAIIWHRYPMDPVTIFGGVLAILIGHDELRKELRS